MKRKKVPSASVGILKMWYGVLLVLAFILVVFAPRLAVAEPKINRNDIYWIPSLISEEDQIKHYIRQKFPESPEIAIAIATAESRLDPNAHGDKNNRLAPQGSHGVFQINVAVHQEKLIGRDVNNWKDNIDIAREIYDEGGWRPWGAFTSGNYKQYIK